MVFLRVPIRQSAKHGDIFVQGSIEYVGVLVNDTHQLIHLLFRKLADILSAQGDCSLIAIVIFQKEFEQGGLSAPALPDYRIASPQSKTLSQPTVELPVAKGEGDILINGVRLWGDG